MRHEKIIKREDGSEVRIVITSWLDSISGMHWNAVVYNRQPKKHKWYDVHDSHAYAFRSLNSAERKRHIESRQLEFVTPSEMLAAKLELWEMIKPTL